MNLQIINFGDNKNQINKNSFCIKNDGNNIAPIITWNEIPHSKSYALIMEDPYSIHGNTIHWFLPSIYKNTVINGLNSYNKYGYFGPCPPINTGKHKYIFTLYSLDTILNFDLTKKIKSSKYFEKILKKNKVVILNKNIKFFYYNTNNTNNTIMNIKKE